MKGNILTIEGSMVASIKPKDKNINGNESIRQCDYSFLNLGVVSSIASRVNVPSSFVFPSGVSKNYKTGFPPKTMILNKFTSNSSSFFCVSSPLLKELGIKYLTRAKLNHILMSLVPKETPNGIVVHFIPPVEAPKAPIVKSRGATLTDLKRRRDELQRENNELRRRITVFKQMVKDKKIITEIVIHGKIVKLYI